MLLLSTCNASAQFLTVSFGDSVGDHLGATNLSQLDFTFNISTGEYQVLLRATPDHPFVGRFVVGVNLFNPDTGTKALNPSFSNTTQADDEVGTDEIGMLRETTGFQDVRNPPVVEDDFYEIHEDSGFSELDILGNDCSTSEGFAALSILDLKVDGIMGEILLIGDRVRDQPAVDFFGEESFDYTVVDSAGMKSAGMVSISVLSVNDPLIAVDDEFELDGNIELQWPFPNSQSCLIDNSLRRGTGAKCDSVEC